MQAANVVLGQRCIASRGKGRGSPLSTEHLLAVGVADEALERDDAVVNGGLACLVIKVTHIDVRFLEMSRFVTHRG
jgi:hypothetical protein